MNRDIASAADQQTNTVSDINHLLKDVSEDTNNSVNAANSMTKESEKLHLCHNKEPTCDPSLV